LGRWSYRRAVLSDAAGIFEWSSAALNTAKAVIALVGAALLALDALLRRHGRAHVLRRTRDGLLVATAAAAALAWLRFAPLGVWNHVHVWEHYHHGIGAKYFRELGYTRLYDCTVIADAEAGFGIPPERRPVRRLDTNRVEKGDRILPGADACKSRFTPERWAAFQHDVGVFRGSFVERRWGSILTDHGFNASPVWTLVGAALVPAGPFRIETLHRLARIDLVLLAATMAAGFWGFGLRAGCAALIYFGTNYLSDYTRIGGGFLRYDWLAASVIGAALVQRGWPAAGGAALTWAALVRVFPGFLVAAVGLHAAIDLLRRRSLAVSAPHRRFAAGCLLALATLVPLSVATAGRDAWPDFVANSRKHLATPLLNFVGWKTLVAFDPATTAGALRDESLGDPYERWHTAVRDNFERRKVAFGAGVAAFVALLAAALSRTPIGAAPLLGVGLVVTAAEIGSYYYALLLGYGLLAGRFQWVGVGLLLCSAATLGVADTVGGSRDVGMAVWSALWFAFALAVTAGVAWRGVARRDDRA
jgi:hypothetical protein